VSLRLLGRLDEDLSCANSRYFRKLLYPRPEIAALMRERFVLHWQSVRPVPVVTFELEGRRLVRTLTGNSLHAILDGKGRPVDALPGLVAPEVFVEELLCAHHMATRVASLGDAEHASCLASMHASAAQRTAAAVAARQAAPPPRAVRASVLAPTKHAVEAPLLAQLRALARTLEEDTRQNLALHEDVHRAFADGAPWGADADAMVQWIYEELFLMKADDPWLGLAPPDAFTALDAPTE
jgi:hypothetical protein